LPCHWFRNIGLCLEARAGPYSASARPRDEIFGPNISLGVEGRGRGQNVKAEDTVRERSRGRGQCFISYYETRTAAYETVQNANQSNK